MLVVLLLFLSLLGLWIESFSGKPKGYNRFCYKQKWLILHNQWRIKTVIRDFQICVAVWSCKSRTKIKLLKWLLRWLTQLCSKPSYLLRDEKRTLQMYISHWALSLLATAAQKIPFCWLVLQARHHFLTCFLTPLKKDKTSYTVCLPWNKILPMLKK